MADRKPWDDCTDEERIEILHEDVAKISAAINSFIFQRETMVQEIGNLRAEVDALKTKLKG